MYFKVYLTLLLNNMLLFWFFEQFVLRFNR